MRSKLTRLRLVVAVAVVALVSLVLGLFDMSPVSGVTSSVTIERGFRGVVSAQAPCQASRTVEVKRRRGRHKRPRNKVIGTVQTDANGNWSFSANRQFGTYFAKAPQETKTSTGTGYGYGYGYSSVPVNCEKGKSADLSFGRRPRPRRR
jgi:hypothetical protein